MFLQRDDIGFSLMKFTQYIEEIQSYQKAADYLKDFAFTVSRLVCVKRKV